MRECAGGQPGEKANGAAERRLKRRNSGEELIDGTRLVVVELLRTSVSIDGAIV